jgi:hypothetical protein
MNAATKDQKTSKSEINGKDDKETLKRSKFVVHEMEGGAKVDILDEKALYPWQSEVVAKLRDSKVDAKVHWVWDQKGSTGKTQLARFLLVHDLALPLNYLTTKDWQRVLMRCFDRPAYVFRLAKTRPKEVPSTHLYKIVAGLKKSEIRHPWSGKVRPPAHVWVFASFAPDQPAILPKHRVVVYTITDTGLSVLGV